MKAVARPVVNATTLGIGAAVVSMIEGIWCRLVVTAVAALVCAAFGAGVFCGGGNGGVAVGQAVAQREQGAGGDVFESLAEAAGNAAGGGE